MSYDFLNFYMNCGNCGNPSIIDNESDISVRFGGCNNAILGIDSIVSIDKYNISEQGYYIINWSNKDLSSYCDILECWICQRCNNYNWISINIFNSRITRISNITLSKNSINQSSIIYKEIVNYVSEYYSIDFKKLYSASRDTISAMIRSLDL